MFENQEILSKEMLKGFYFEMEVLNWTGTLTEFGTQPYKLVSYR